MVPLLNLYPKVLLSSKALNGLGAIQNSKGDRATSLFISHLIVTSAILFEFADRVVLQSDIDCLMKVNNLRSILYSFRHSSIQKWNTES